MKFNKFYSCVLWRESCHKEHKSLVIPMKNVPLHNAFFFFFGLTMKQKNASGFATNFGMNRAVWSNLWK